MTKETAKNNRHKCSECGKTIEKGTIFYSIYYSSKFGGSHKNICIECMLIAVVENYGNTREISKKWKRIIKEQVLNKIE